MLALLLACTAPSDDSAPLADTAPVVGDVDWAKERPALDNTSAGGRAWKRGIIHLHSHYSHDACDGEPIVDGVPREDCLADLRYGLCATGMDFAFVTDHPAHMAEQPFADLLLMRAGDEEVDGIANRMSCLDSTGGDQRVLLMPGVEDELMPIGLDRQVSDDPVEADRIYNGGDAETVSAEIAAGALVMQAHTEGRPLSLLQERQTLGQTGVELFNLHAMFDPDIREEDLGLDGTDWIGDVAPFLTGATSIEPDLAFLAVFQEQTVSVERWDALNAVAPSVGIAGTDAHENVLPSPASDGERFDSYRRMMSWFSNVVLAEDAAGDGLGPDDYQAAVAAGRLFVAFESLGTPSDWVVSYGAVEMGGTAPAGDTLTVSCPTLAPTSPQKDTLPDIRVVVFRDGAPWQEGCGSWTLTDAGVYRAVAYITPWHLEAFLEGSEHLVREYPWLYSNAIRVGL